MNSSNKKFQLPEWSDEIFAPDDLVKIPVERNGCIYFWGIPHKICKSSRFQKLKAPYVDADLEALGGILLGILVINDRYSINFNQKTGVQRLSVTVRSSESEDRQLLHKLVTGIRAKDKQLNRDIIPGTNNGNE